MDSSAPPAVRPHIILLPGLDGDGFYLEPLRDLLRQQYECRILSYPPHLADYGDLCEWVCGQLDPGTHYIIVAESFGGPLAIMVAQALKERAAGLVLCATFWNTPGPRPFIRFAALVFPLVVRRKWTASLINQLLYNRCSANAADRLHQVLKGLPENTIPRRLRALCSLDGIRPAAIALNIPCLVIEPTHDRLLKRGTFGKLWPVEHIDSPHEVLGTRPEEAARFIKEFCERSKGVTQAATF